MQYQSRKYRDNQKNRQNQTWKVENTYLNINKALEFVGDNSTFQKNVITIFSIQWMLFSFLIMGMPLLFQQPVYKCLNTENLDDQQYYFCSETEACKVQESLGDNLQNYEAFIIDKELSNHTLVLEFQLYCDRRYLVGLTGSIFFIGAAVAGYIFPKIAHKNGRKQAILYSILLSGISITLAGLSLNIYMFIFFIFFSGIGLNGFETLTLVYVTEISAEKFRNFSSVTLTTSWAIAQIIYSGISLFITNWRIICLIVIGIPFLLSYYSSKKHLLETPRYLVSHQRFDEAREVLSKISITNNRPRFEYKLEGELEEQDPSLQYLDPERFKNQQNTQQDFITPERQAINYTYIDLFRHSSLRITTISMVILWIFRYITYFGQSFSLSSLGGEIHMNLVLMGISEVVACLLAAPIKLKLARIKTLSLFALIASCGCIFTILLSIPEDCYLPGNSCIQKGIQVVFAQAIKFSITLYMSILITYTSEVYPTVVRSLGYGICMTAGKGGTILMPLIVSYFQSKDISPLIVFGIFGLFVVFIILRLPETKDIQMQDFLEETNQNNIPILKLQEFDSNQNNMGSRLIEEENYK